jgi:uncharacterized OB-fold protein
MSATTGTRWTGPPGSWVLPGEGPGPWPLTATRCPGCGLLSYADTTECPACDPPTATDPVPLSGRGTLYACTEVAVRHAWLESPYLIGYVDTPEGVRLFGLLRGWPAGVPDPGAAVAAEGAVLGHRPDGAPVVGVVLRPAAEDPAPAGTDPTPGGVR